MACHGQAAKLRSARRSEGRLQAVPLRPAGRSAGLPSRRYRLHNQPQMEDCGLRGGVRVNSSRVKGGSEGRAVAWLEGPAPASRKQGPGGGGEAIDLKRIQHGGGSENPCRKEGVMLYVLHYKNIYLGVWHRPTLSRGWGYTSPGGLGPPRHATLRHATRTQTASPQSVQYCLGRCAPAKAPARLHTLTPALWPSVFMLHARLREQNCILSELKLVLLL